MNLFRMLFEGLTNGVRALAAYVPPYASGAVRNSTLAFDMLDTDIEMNDLAAHGEIDLNEAQETDSDIEAISQDANHESPFRNFYDRYFPWLNFRMPTIDRLALVRRFAMQLDGWESVVVVLLVLVFLWADGLFEPLGSNIKQVAVQTWYKPQGTASGWPTPSATLATTGNDHNSVSGPYFVRPSVSLAELIGINAPTTLDAAATTVIQHSALSHPDHPVAKHTTVETHHDQYQGPYHYAYPIHAGRVVKSNQAMKIKSRLERCAGNMSRKLNGQALEITAGLEFALHDCKSVVDFALETLYPQSAAPYEPTRTSTASVTVYGVVPGRLPSPTPPTAKAGLSLRSLISKRGECSGNFCDWASPDNLDRCYQRDEAQYQKTGKVTYLNDTIDDFKDSAPLECNLCLPVINNEEIETHCQKVEAAEKGLIGGLLIGLGALLLVLSIVLVVKVGLGRLGRHAGDPGANDQELGSLPPME